MIWVIWRQYRRESIVMLLVLVLVGVLVLSTGLLMTQGFQQLGLSTCLGHPETSGPCHQRVQLFEQHYVLAQGLGAWLLMLPLLLGLLGGIPLVGRELAQRTHTLAWTQSLTRTRWFLVKVALVLGASLLVSGIALALLTWWRGPWTQIDGFPGTIFYDMAGPVWLTTTLLILALSIFAGTLTHGEGPATILLMIVLFLVIRAPMEVLVRPYLEPTVTVTWALADQNGAPTLSSQDEFISSGYLDSHGNEVTAKGCTANETVKQCFQANDVVANDVTYLPGDHFWIAQWIEASIYLAFAVLALGAAAWLVRRVSG